MTGNLDEFDDSSPEDGDDLYRVMYLSRATHPMTEEALAELLDSARERNRAHRISGMLLYDAGHFAQVLEGPMEEVGRLMARIERDSRHTDIVPLSAGSIDARFFDGWGMDWTHLDREDDSEHEALRRYMRSHHVGDRSTVYRALVLFAEEHGERLRRQRA